MKKYMTASEAYRETFDEIKGSCVSLAAANPKNLRALANRLELVADYFVEHPDRWTCGAYQDETRVCSVGLLTPRHRKAAGIKDFKVRIKPTVYGAWWIESFLMSVNDVMDSSGAFPIGPRSLRSVNRVLASFLRELADSKAAGEHFSIEAVEKGLQKRLETAARKAEFYKTHKKQATATAGAK